MSVAMVVGLHTLQRFSLTHPVPWGLYVFANGDLGVQIFFVISGFLITTLLLRERETTGQIRLGAFYVRRAFRILPPLYAYILVIAVLAHLGHLPGINRGNLLLAFALMQNYVHWSSVWVFEHFWSLCIEEQFYLLWPGLLAFCVARKQGKHGREIAARIALAAALVQPLLRIVYAQYFPAPHYYRMFHLASDGIMIGAIGALLYGTRRFEAIYLSLTRWPYLLPLALFLFSALDIRFENYFNLTIGATLQSITILMWLLWLTRNPATSQGRILNQPAIAWVGRLSYSIYLWQTLFLHHQNVTVFGAGTRFSKLFSTFPGNWIAILTVAAFSYYAIEQPSLRLRDLTMKTLHWRAA